MKRILVTLALVCGALAGCASDADSVSGGSPIRVLNAYVRAAQEPMTGAFMIIQNAGSDEVSLLSVSSDVAPKVEIHEVVNGMMQPKVGGIAIPAGAEAELKPGGDHIMLMGLTEEIALGAEVSLLLTFSDGSVIDVLAPVKEVNAEQEHYHAP